MNENQRSLEALEDIRRMMERSSRFISLSGLSGVSAGLCALAGAFIAHDWIQQYHETSSLPGSYGSAVGNVLVGRLLLLAALVLVAALVSAFYFTWRKTKKQELPIWGHSSRKLLINILIPLVTGGLFVLGLLYHGQWQFAAPSCFIFYGLALVNASKFTLSEIRYIGLLEILLGLINLFWPGYSLYFWGIGFGLLHIGYGAVMWWKYDQKKSAA